MRGLLHDCLKHHIVEKTGREGWKRMLTLTKTSEEDYLKLRHYSDEMTIHLIRSSSQILHCTEDEAMEEFGVAFLKYTMDLGYGHSVMLRTLGQEFLHFVEHMDAIHNLVSVSYPGIVPPMFRHEYDEEGHLILNYYSCRDGLERMVVGMLKAVATIIYSTKCDPEILEVKRHPINKTETWNHVVIRLAPPPSVSYGVPSLKKPAYNPNAKPKPMSAEEASAMKCPFSGKDGAKYNPVLTEDHISYMFPYVITFDRNLIVKHVGYRVNKLCPKVKPGAKMDRVSNVVSPPMPYNYEGMIDFHNSNIVLNIFETPNKPSVLLKGHMIPIDDSHVMYLAFPKMRTLDEMKEKNIFLSDSPTYDVTRHFMLLNQLRQAEINIGAKLEETTAALNMTANALEEEKDRAENLLSQMLPKKVADQLRAGKNVPGERFTHVTIMFSHVDGFSEITSKVPPQGIVDLLNEVFSLFDDLIAKNGVYKVETIGDSYMVISGAPDPTDDHAARVANFAIDMMDVSTQATNPVTNKPIVIGCGLHSGSIVAGIVGAKAPRYCLFGDTVNTASRMDSHGMPSKIHCSPFAYKYLQERQFQTKSRGEINVKGKGPMETHFLVGRPRGPAIKELFPPDPKDDPRRQDRLKQLEEEAATAQVA